MTTELKLSYEERQAIAVIRKAMLTKPEIVTHLLKDITKDSAVNLLLQAQKEVNNLLAVTRAFSSTAAVLVKIDDDQTKHTDTI